MSPTKERIYTTLFCLIAWAVMALTLKHSESQPAPAPLSLQERAVQLPALHPAYADPRLLPSLEGRR